MNVRTTITAALLALALVTCSVVAFAQGGKGQRGGGQQGKIFQQLTDEQKTQLQTKLEELKAAGAKPEEVRATVQEMLKGWGIETPQGQGGRGAGMRAVMEKLTPEQREQLQAKMKEMRQANKTHEEIRAAMQEMLKGWGIEMPHGEGGQGGGRKALMEKLTPEQREQLQAKMKEMRQANKTPEEIRATMQEMLKGWGIEMPQGQRGEGKQAGEGRQNRGQKQDWIGQLTEDQRTQLKAKMDELKAAGAKPEEIRAAVAELCKGWGIETPKAGGQRDAGLMKDLTPEQRQQVQAKVKEMKAAGAKREEIRAAIQELLKAQPAPAK
ncbi:MAG: hypothetical protein ABFE08_22895 [Armatimonadia bacterium]